MRPQPVYIEAMDQIILWLQQYGLAAVFLNASCWSSSGCRFRLTRCSILHRRAELQQPIFPRRTTSATAVGPAPDRRPAPGTGPTTATAAALLKTLCRISLSPDSCVQQTESIFTRWGVKSLVLAKFIQGFASLATALPGRTGVPF